MNPLKLNPEQLARIQRDTDRVAKLMDEAFQIPGTNIRVGWDGILGLFPGVGDVFTLGSHAYLALLAYQARVRKRVYVKMLLNALIDLIVGVIPVFGDLFDLVWKSNRKNAELIRREISRQQ